MLYCWGGIYEFLNLVLDKLVFLHLVITILLRSIFIELVMESAHIKLAQMKLAL